MTKILYLITKSNWGGAQKYVYDLALAARERGLDVVVMLGGNGELKTKLEQSNIRVITLPYLERDVKILADIKTFFDLIKIFKQEKPDVIHLNSSKIGGLGALAGHLSGVPKIIFTGHGWAFNEDRPRLVRLAIWLLHWLTVLLCHRVIAVSRQTAKQLSILPFTKRRITVIYNGLKPLSFLTKAEARARLTPDHQNALWIGTIAELHRNKGLDVLLKALPLISKNRPALHLLIIGEGEERARLTRLIDAYGLTAQVTLGGWRADAAQYLPAFDVFTLSSRTEALPYVLLEAGAAGLPVVASRVGGIPEIVTDGESGLLVSPGNYKDLALALEKLLTNKKLAQTYGKNLKKKIFTQFSQEQMLNHTFTLYEK